MTEEESIPHYAEGQESEYALLRARCEPVDVRHLRPGDMLLAFPPGTPAKLNAVYDVRVALPSPKYVRQGFTHWTAVRHEHGDGLTELVAFSPCILYREKI